MLCVNCHKNFCEGHHKNCPECLATRPERQAEAKRQYHRKMKAYNKTSKSERQRRFEEYQQQVKEAFHQ